MRDQGELWKAIAKSGVSGSSAARRRILVLVDYYSPGYKAGGQLRSVTNLVAALGEDFEFLVLTSDRDLNDQESYPNIVSDSWAEVGRAQVMYLSPSRRKWISWVRLLRSLTYDVLYVNGYFSRISIKTMIARRWGWIPRKPSVLAPRGELSSAALNQKKVRKRFFRWVAKRTRLHEGVIWHASTPGERDEIMTALASNGDKGNGRGLAVSIAPDLVSSGRRPDATFPPARPQKEKSAAKIAFLSRISRMKNLGGIIDALATVTGEIEFDVYGPIEDAKYWQECQRAIRALPSSVHLQYRGAVPAERVVEVLGQYHFFTLLTHGESFGHAIIEAMLAGCPVLVTDQTPWRGLAAKRVGWDVPIGQSEAVAEALSQMIQMDQKEFDQWSAAARSYAEEHIQSADQIEANRRLFADVAS